MPAERRAQLLITTSRALSAAVGVAAAAAMLHSFTSGRDPLPIVPTTLGVFGVTMVLQSVLRERNTMRQSAALTALVIGGTIAWSFTLATRQPDGLAVLTRLIAFGILGEILLWRVLSAARGLNRWREVRNDMLLSLFLVIVAALDPGPIDRDPLPALGLTVAVAGAVALSLARAVEELSVGKRNVTGRAPPATATGTALLLGAVALAAVVFLPVLQALVAETGRLLAPVLSNVLFAILLPLGYLAGWIAYAVLWLRDALHLGPFLVPQPPTNPYSDNDDLARRLREMEEQRPYVFGAIEIVIAVVAVLVAIALVGRLITERRAQVAAGVEIEREAAEGIGLRAMLGLILPRRASRPHPPPDDGTPSGRLRRIYWALLDLAERQGPGRRAASETPAEHERRLLENGVRWRDASAIVRAFEDLRYGEIDPDPATVARAREALARVEAAT